MLTNFFRSCLHRSVAATKFGAKHVYRHQPPTVTQSVGLVASRVLGLADRRCFAAVQGNDLKKGMLIKIDDGIFQVSGLQTVRSGKGGAFVQAEVKNIRGGSKTTQRFRSKGEKIEEVVIDDVSDYQVLEVTKTAVTLMHTTTFEQQMVDRSLFGDSVVIEGSVVNVSSSEGEVSPPCQPL